MLLIPLIFSLLTALSYADEVRVGLYGERFMEAVEASLNQLGLPFERLDPHSLERTDPASLQVLFVAYDAGDDAAWLEWVERFLAGGGRLFTFFVLPQRLQQLLHIRQGAFLQAGPQGRFARIAPSSAYPSLPGLRQDSWNIYRAEPTSDSVRVAATWLDAGGADTGEPALLIGPSGAHLTHVLLGRDPVGAARTYAALLGHFFPRLWPRMLRGALEAAGQVGGSREALAVLAQKSSRARRSLKRAREARRRSEEARRRGDYGEALARAFEAKRFSTLAFARAQQSRAGEFRAVWIHNPFGVADWGWERSIQVLAAAGFNAILPNMLDAGLTSYPSRVLPEDPRAVERGDQMAALVEASHHYGLEVHVWKVNYNLGSADSAFVAAMRRAGRLQRNPKGEEIQWLCPSHPDNIRLEVESMLEIARNYDIDGLHLDYIRYPGAEGCYDEGCRLRFQEQTGHHVDHWPEDVLSGELVVPYQKWRQEQITRLVRALSIQARRIRPNLKISAAVFADWPQSRYAIGQDWVQWLEAGYLDFVCPMDYIPDMERFKATVQRQVDWVDGRVPLYIGIGAWQLPSAEEVIRQILWTRNAGADGFVLFEYAPDLAASILPLLHQGISARKTQPPHRGPYVFLEAAGDSTGAQRSEVPPGDQSAGVLLYPEGTAISASARLVPSALARWAEAELSLRTLSDAVVLRFGRLRTGSAVVSNSPPWRITPAAGDYRMVAAGKYRNAAGHKRAFIHRGPLLRIRSRASLDSLALLYGPPVIPDSGIAVGVLAGGYGGKPLLDLIEADSALAGFRLRRVEASSLAAVRILVIPQPHNRYSISPALRTTLRQWIRRGGRLLVTHDMAGIRGIRSLVPEICARGTGFPRSRHWQVIARHAAVKGVAPGLQGHSYYDHVTLEAGPEGTVLAADEEGRPVLAVGAFGAGRYAALGLVPGLGPDEAEVAVEGGEKQLVQSLLRWLAEGL